MEMRRVLLLGATGLVGSEILKLLLDDGSITRVDIISRRAVDSPHAKIDQHVVDLAEMDRHRDAFAVDQIFCALGTTIRKAGSQSEFRRIDRDLPLRAAELGREGGARHFLLVSAIGADSGSRVFYNRVKGEAEEAISALEFPSLTIARPSLLLGPRTEWRLGEELAKPLGWLMPPKYRPIEARDVARVLIEAARADRPGMRVLESREMREVTRRHLEL